MTWRRSRKLLASVLACALVAAGCGGGSVASPPRLVVVQVPASGAPGGRVLTTGFAGGAPPGARTPGSRPGHVRPHRHPPDRPPLPSPAQLTVQVTRPVALRSAPGGPVVARLAAKTSFGSATVVPVVAQRGSWLGVITSSLPNGQVGWIPVNAALVAYRTPWSISASLSRRQVVVRDGGRVVMRFPVAIGGPTTPTPTGRFAVTDKLLTNDPSSPYGCCILALSARQPHTPQGWGGGDRIAIHATDLPETIGSAASLGCLRAPEADARRLVRTIPLGTVVTISA